MKRSTKDTLTFAALAIVTVGAVCIGIYYEMAMWQECRETNSFWYCMRVLGK